MRSALSCLIAYAVSLPVVAAELDLDAAVQRALAGNPELRLSTYRRQIQEGEIVQASLKPRLELLMELENFVGSGDFRGVDGAEATLSLVWTLERGKRERRQSVAEAGLEVVAMETELQALATAADTAEAFLAVLRDQERYLLAGEAVQLAERAVAAASQRVRSGRSPETERLQAEADLTWSRLAQEDVAHQLRVARRQLAASWGAAEPDFSVAMGNLAALPDPGSWVSLLERVSASPRINQYLTRRRLHDAELRLAEAEAKADWRVKAGARYLNLVDEAAAVASITMPLGFDNLNQGRIASAQARAEMTEGERVATRVRIEATLFRLHQELLHNVHRAEAMRSELLPRVEAIVEAAESAYQAGRYAYFELRMAQRAWLDLRSALLEESYRAHSNRIGIERLTGTLVTGRDRS